MEEDAELHRQCLELQRDEIESLRSIFCGTNEFILLCAPEYLEVFESSTKASASFQLLLTSGHNEEFITMSVTLPWNYPLRTFPKVKLQCSCKSIEMHSAFEAELERQEHGSVCIFTLAQWIKDHCFEYFKEERLVRVNTTTDVVFVREWLYFIGFYTKKIRTAFVELANELKLTGFLMPGKPALSCVEGSEASIEEFIFRVRVQLFAIVPAASRKMSRLCTVKKLISMQELAIESKFSGFEEVDFTAECGHSHAQVVDLSKLRLFLAEKGLEAYFYHIFGQ